MKVSNISKKYKNKVILNDISIEINIPGIYLLKGESGVGKTTLLNIISGLDLDYTGNVELYGEIGYARQEVCLFNNLTLRENLELFCEINENIVQKFELYDVLDYKISKLSGGQKTCAELLCTYVLNIDIILIDEPTTSLDDETANVLLNLISKLAKDKIILIVTHDTIFDKIACDVYWLDGLSISNEKENFIEQNKIFTYMDNKFKPSKFHVLKYLYIENKFIYISQILLLVIVMLLLLVVNIKVSNFYVFLYNDFVGAYGEDTIRVELGYIKNEEAGKYARERINFSDSDLVSVEKLKDVEEAYFYNEYIYSITDEHSNILDLTSDGKTFEFHELPTPYGREEDLNLEGIDVVGSYPKLGDNEIIIPTDLCDYLRVDCNNITNKKIKIPLTNEKTKYGEYKVVGYYNSDLDFSDVSYVYTPYFPVEVLSDTQLKLVYENYIDSDGVYNKSNFESFDNFKKSYGSGSSSMMVISNNIDQTSNDILKACSYCSISSNKSERSRIIKSIKSRIIKTVILEIIVIIILYSFYVLNFKNINTLKRRSKIKLIIHNYDKNYIKKLLIYEMVIYLCTTSSILAIIYISLDIQYTFALVPSILFILISLLVSLFFDIKNLKSRKIMKLLNRK